MPIKLTILIFKIYTSLIERKKIQKQTRPLADAMQQRNARTDVVREGLDLVYAAAGGDAQQRHHRLRAAALHGILLLLLAAAAVVARRACGAAAGFELGQGRARHELAHLPGGDARRRL